MVVSDGEEINVAARIHEGGGGSRRGGRTGSSTEQSNPLLKGRLGVRIPPGACGVCAPVARWQSRRLLSGGVRVRVPPGARGR